jgi:cephalosporin hydroxylase
VITVGRGDATGLDGQLRLTHVPGPAEDPDVAAQVLATAGDGAAMVFLALGQDRRVVAAFEHYAPLVTEGGYVVVENTVVNGRPAAPGFGAGPLEAVFQILAAHPEFVSDHAPERYTVTFNRDGFLRRMEAR